MQIATKPSTVLAIIGIYELVPVVLDDIMGAPQVPPWRLGAGIVCGLAAVGCALWERWWERRRQPHE
jgi:hypothetical protein